MVANTNTAKLSDNLSSKSSLNSLDTTFLGPMTSKWLMRRCKCCSMFRMYRTFADILSDKLTPSGSILQIPLATVVFTRPAEACRVEEPATAPSAACVRDNSDHTAQHDMMSKRKRLRSQSKVHHYYRLGKGLRQLTNVVQLLRKAYRSYAITIHSDMIIQSFNFNKAI
jgi:hypothetical protein